MDRDTYDLVVIGGGPAGIMAAIFAAKRGKKVCILEKNATLGRKLLATGNGRCNFTNMNITPERYHGSDKSFIKKVLETLTSKDTISFFESLGVFTKEEDRGRVFPRTNQASTILDALIHLLRDLKVDVYLESEVKEANKKESWSIKCSNSHIYTGTNLLIATGGRAAHQFGSSGDGLYWARKLGHNTIPSFAALAPVETEETWVKEVQGLKLNTMTRCFLGSSSIGEKEGDIIFTQYGVSGPAVMALSGLFAPKIENINPLLTLDLFPDKNEKELDRSLELIFKNNPKKTVQGAMHGLIPQKIIPIILHTSKVESLKKVSELSAASRNTIVRNLKALNLHVKKVRPLKEAQVSSGGVDLSEINPQNLQSKKIPGLYFAGEILDVWGDSGGFNLQWAWSSGYVVGQSV